MTAQPKVNLQLLAQKAINLKLEIDSKSSTLENMKETFRRYYGDQGHRVDVPGLGYVLVKQGAEPHTSERIVFDEKKWQELPQQLRDQLISAGVVRHETKRIPAKKPAVQVYPNT